VVRAECESHPITHQQQQQQQQQPSFKERILLERRSRPHRPKNRGIARNGKHVWAGWRDQLAVKQKAFAAWQTFWNSTPKDDDPVVPPPPPDAPIQIISLNNDTTDPSNKPTVAIITSSRSMFKVQSPETSPLWKYTVHSLINSVTRAEREQWKIHVFVALDDNDAWWQQHCHAFQKMIPPWLTMTFAVFAKKRPGHIPFNEIAYLAYRAPYNAEYFVRVNDDSEFLSQRWITASIQALQSYQPPNVGVVGPVCEDGNSWILTHDVVHRTHMDIFQGYYYPNAFDNWYLDDWISFQYHHRIVGPNFVRVQTLPGFRVKHWTAGKRYDSNSVDAQYLPVEYDRGRRLIRSYLQQHHAGWEQQVAQQLQLPFLQKHDVIRAAVANVLPGDGNLLVWGLDLDSHYWHRSTSGRVLFLSDPKFASNNHPSKLLNPFLDFRDVEHPPTVQRGNAQIQRENYERFVKDRNMTDSHKLWCNDLKLTTSFPPDAWSDTLWDVILVSAPGAVETEYRVNESAGPGVWQSLFTTQQLVLHQMTTTTTPTKSDPTTSLPENNKVIHIFVDHYHRPYEQEFADKLFGKKPKQVLSSTLETNTSEGGIFWEKDYAAAHYMIQHSDEIVRRAESYFC